MYETGNGRCGYSRPQIPLHCAEWVCGHALERGFVVDTGNHNGTAVRRELGENDAHKRFKGRGSQAMMNKILSSATRQNNPSKIALVEAAPEPKLASTSG